MGVYAVWLSPLFVDCGSIKGIEAFSVYSTTKTAVFLASDDSRHVTGIELFVDGGMAQI